MLLKIKHIKEVFIVCGREFIREARMAVGSRHPKLLTGISF